MGALLAAIVLIGVSSVQANPASRTVGVVAGTYTEINGGTVLYSSASPSWFTLGETTVTLPFQVNYGGVLYTDVVVNANGWVSFGGSAGVTASPLTASGTAAGVLSAMGTQLAAGTGGDVTVLVTGTAPNRIATMQWRNATRRYADNIARDNYNFQIRLWENNATANGSRMEVVYGAMTANHNMLVQVGLGANGTVWSPRANFYANTWSTASWHATPQLSLIARGFVPASGTTVAFWNRQAPALNNDADVLSLVSPAGNFDANTSQSMQVRVRNFGTNNLDSVTINWSINGVAQTPVRFYPQPALAPGAEATVTLGSRSFAPFSFNTVTFSTSTPNGVADVNPSNDALTVFLAPRVAGDLSVAQNGNANSFPDFRTMFRHLAVSGISGNVNVTVYAGTYNEQIWVPAINATSGRVQLSRNAGDDVVLTGTVHAGFNVLGTADVPNVIGHADGSANVTWRNLTVRAIDGSSSNLVVFGSAVGANTRYEGCTFEGPANYLTTVGPTAGVLVVSGSTGLTMTGNTFRRFLTGLNVSGTGAVVTNNVTENCRSGYSISNSASALIEGNQATDCDCSTGATGISVSASNNAIIRGNRINQIRTAGISNGIVCQTSTGLLLANNMVSVAGTSQAIGIWVDNLTPSNTLIHNTVNVTGNASISTAGYFPSNGGTVNLINNVFHNFGTGTASGWAMWFTGNTPNPLGTADFNNHMVTGANLVNWGGVLVPRVAGSNPLSSWRAGSGRDQNSASVAVNFVGGTDLRLLSIQPQLWGTATTLASVPRDFDGETRTKPYMGADEIKPVIRMVTNPQSSYVCLGGTDTLICIADVTVGATTTYQWFKDGKQLTGQTGNILVHSNVGYSAAGVYTCVVRANDGTNFVQATSEGATIIVVRPTNVTVQPVSQAVALGGTANLEVAVEAVGAPDNFLPAYQWKKRFWNPTTVSYNDTNVVDNGNITGSNSSILTIRNVTAIDTADTYVCEIAGYCGTVTTKTARLFAPLVVASNSTPAVCTSGTLTLDCAAFPASLPGAVTSYQWMRNGIAVDGATSKVFTANNATPALNGTYTCVVSYEGTGLSFTSTPVNVTVGVAPQIAAQPENTTVCVGKPLTLSTQASGDNVTYQWFKGTTAIPMATAAAYDKATTSVDDAGSYSVVATNACGSSRSVQVDVVINTEVSITKEPADVAINDNEKLTFTVEATASDAVSYKWFHNNTEIAGATTATYTVDNAKMSDAGEYYCVVTNSCGEKTTRKAVASITNGVTGDVVANGFVLSIATPNPTFEAASFAYTVPAAQNVRIVLTDLMGRELGVLVNGMMEAGTHRASFNATAMNLTAGVYNITLSAGGFVASQQVVVVK
jgi:hypothetical protein